LSIQRVDAVSNRYALKTKKHPALATRLLREPGGTDEHHRVTPEQDAHFAGAGYPGRSCNKYEFILDALSYLQV